MPKKDQIVSNEALDRIIAAKSYGWCTLRAETGMFYNGVPDRIEIAMKAVMPAWLVMAWLNSYATIGTDPDNDGSELVVLYFTHEPTLDVPSIMDGIDWNQHARDYGI